ncbi:MAG: hypothetical protein Q4D79_09090 [Propionibacteriaceae bacterium]|nr:hypothetical protein [Propionibacteriaceae bacterium]
MTEIPTVDEHGRPGPKLYLSHGDRPFTRGGCLVLRLGYAPMLSWPARR